MLSENSTYAAYMVFKLATYEFRVRDVQFEEASINVGGCESTQRICLVGCAEDNKDSAAPNDMASPSSRRVLLKPVWKTEACVSLDLPENVVASQRRADGWMEVELGEFYNKGGDDHVEVCISLRRTTIKQDFIIRRIDIRSRRKS
jgi:hypothetical protein